MDVAVFVFYLLATIIYTYPLIRHFSTDMLGYCFADPSEFPWDLWWTKHALVDLRVSPFHTDYIFGSSQESVG